MWETLLTEVKNLLGPALAEKYRVGIWPGAVTAGILALATVVGHGRIRAALMPLAVAGGLATSFILFNGGLPSFPPVSATAWFPWLVVGTAVVLAVAGAVGWRRVAILLGAVCGVVAVYYAGAFAGPSKAQLATVGGPAILLVVTLCISSETSEERIHRTVPWLVWPIVFGGMSVALTYAVANMVAMAAASGVTVAGLVLVGGALQKDEELYRPGMVASVYFAMLWVNALLFSRLGTPAALCLGGAALAPLLAGFVPVGKTPRGVLAVLLAVALVGVAIVLVYRSQAGSHGGW